MWRASPYKTLLTTQPPHPGLPILGDPRTVSWIWRKCLVESHIAQGINVLSDFFKSDYLSVFLCVVGLRRNPVARWNMAEMIFSLFAEKLALSLPWTFSTSAWQSTNWSCAVLSLFAIAVREFQVSNKMPDYLGKDQRKIKDDEKKDDKPIQGASDTLNHTKSRRDLLVTRLTSFSLRLHMETRIQIFD